MEKSQESYTFTVGKLDAGMAILLGERAHLIEFPSILLPPGATTGSIVSIAVHQNVGEEKRRDNEFWSLQNDILQEFGVQSPENPKVEVRNVTQTSVTLEWPALQLATAKLRSLDIYRNSQRLAAIPSPLTNTSTKLSGLETNMDYTFQLVLRTTAGTFPSNLIRVRTHTMADTSGISVCFGNVQDEVMLENAKVALKEMRAKWSDKIQIDTTHFVCTTPATTPGGAQATGSPISAPGVEYQRALQLSIPVVQPHWILACHAEKKMVPIAGYYLGVTPTPPISSGRPQSMSHASPRSPTTQSPRTSNRASMPPPSRTPPGNPSNFVNQPAESKGKSMQHFDPTPEEPGDSDDMHLRRTTSTESSRKTRSGTMNREFKFPVSTPTNESPPPPVPTRRESNPPTAEDTRGRREDEDLTSVGMVAPSSEVHPPTPVEKETTGYVDEEEDVGPTEEISLN